MRKVSLAWLLTAGATFGLALTAAGQAPDAPSDPGATDRAPWDAPTAPTTEAPARPTAPDGPAPGPSGADMPGRPQDPTAPQQPPAPPKSDVDPAKPADDGAPAEDEAKEPSPEPSVAELPAALRPELELTLAPNDGVHVGEPLTVTLTAVAPKGTRVSVPKRSLAPFEVLNRNARVEPLPDGRERHVFRLDLLGFEPKEAELPPLELRVVTPNQQVGAVYTQARKIAIESWLANEPDAKPRDATAPVSVMEDDYTLAWLGGGLLLAAILLALGFWLARWFGRRPKSEPPPPPPRPAWEVALEELARLARKRDQWIAEERAAEYVDRVSDIVRAYLGDRYGFDGLESTTDEVVAELSNRRTRELPMTDVVTLLQDCDLVKFAKAEPDADLCETLHAQAKRMVERTTPAADPAPVAEPTREAT